jgi:hypothetical protein
VQIAAIYVSVGFSAGCLLYDGYVFVKSKILSKGSPKKSQKVKLNA